MRAVKKLGVFCVALALVMAVLISGAEAGRYYHHHHNPLLPLAIAGAVVGTAAVIAGATAAPAYPAYYGPAYGPPPVVYGPPPCAYGPVWVPGYRTPYGAWVPGYYR